MSYWEDMLENVAYVFLIVILAAIAAIIVAAVGYVILGLLGFIPDFGGPATCTEVEQP